MGMAIAEHEFYCINCGKKGIPLQRKQGHKHERFHRKKLYCIYCQAEVNHVECKDIDERNKFLTDFKEGVFKDEAKESLLVMRNASIW